MAARVTAFVVIAIVAVTFVAGLIVGAQKEDDSGPVDLIVYNARVYTGNPDARFAEAIAIRGNRIIRVGSNRDVKRLMRRATTVIDAHGGTVTAGFRDGSVDLKAGGLTLAPAALLPIGASADAASAPGTAAAPAASTAVAVSTSVPTSASSSVSSAISGQASTRAATGAGTAGALATTPANAAATAQAGVAQAGLAQTVPGSETGDTLDLIQQAIGHANTVGVTSVGVTARTPDDLLPYDTLLRTRELTARVNAALAAEWPLDEAAVARLDALRKRYEGVPLFKLKAVRLQVTDAEPAAAIGKKTPAKSAKVAHAATATAKTTGAAGAAAASVATAAGVAVAVADAAAAERIEALGRTIGLLEQHDWQIILETKDAGDAGLALDAIEASMRAAAAGGAANTAAATATVTPKHRVRLEVGAMLDRETVARLTRLNVIASAPKPFAPEAASVAATSADGTPAGATSADATSAAAAPVAPARVTEETTDANALAPQDSAVFEAMTRPYANLLASSAPFVLFSAWPATSIDPRVALSLIMVDGMLLAGDKAPDQDTLIARLARAIDACTRYAAFATGDEDQQGTIAKEMLADVVIFSADIFALPPDKLMDAEITTTIFDGKVVYTRPEPTADTSSQ